MGNEPFDPKGKTSELERQVEALKQHLSITDDSIAKSHEILKWGLGIFTTAAVLFSSFNWWTGKSNNDRDQESLKQQVTLLQRQMALSQNELSEANRAEILALEIQVNSNAARITGASKKEIADMRIEAESNVSQIVTQRKYEIVDAIGKLTNFSKEITNLVQKQIDYDMNSVSKYLNMFSQTNAWIMSNLESKVNLGIFKTQGIGLVVQGDTLLYKNKARSAEDITLLGMGIIDMLNAGDDWLNIQDDSALRHCLEKIQLDLPILINCRAPSQLIPTIDDLTGLNSALDRFRNRLEHYENGRYKNEVVWLQLQGELFKKRVAENRRQNITRVVR